MAIVMLSIPPDTFLADASHQKKMDIFEGEMAKLPQTYLPLCHRFTPGLYVREIFMPKGTIVTSRTHKTTHPFVISKGIVDVINEQGKIERLSAPYTGTTNAGTRRVLVTLEDTIWTSFHPTEKTDPIEIEEEITESSNDLIPHQFKPAYLGNPRDVSFLA